MSDETDERIVDKLARDRNPDFQSISLTDLKEKLSYWRARAKALEKEYQLLEEKVESLKRHRDTLIEKWQDAQFDIQP